MRLITILDRDNHEHWVNPLHIVEVTPVKQDRMVVGSAIHLRDRHLIATLAHPKVIAKEFHWATGQDGE